MFRYMAENNIEDPMDIQKFDRLGDSFRADLSSDNEYVLNEIWQNYLDKRCSMWASFV